MNAYYETKSRVTECIPGAFAWEGATGTRLVVTTLPDPELNMVAVGHERDLREVEAFAGELSATSVPFHQHADVPAAVRVAGLPSRRNIDPPEPSAIMFQASTGPR